MAVMNVQIDAQLKNDNPLTQKLNTHAPHSRPSFTPRSIEDCRKQINKAVETRDLLCSATGDLLSYIVDSMSHAIVSANNYSYDGDS